ncbi:uncharacterized protein MYCFIDRAFT_138808 [Pseudocercospora fijiensis CIRAD86]|uniref:Phospholipase/carboxylesterase/thioesterase domain-containing protein n=1 Tax=Pseudocercospora fijiensis (strain CIRAD86) TaxID=383855 RepID=M3ACK8_PSEFD|nr:uncharacterized protein MYCFIDRAFT_138808 [Pseudocercospora fijiensis CIRAD86]EME82276.1 hypothetical protein MYCFIDRAFT_138808 [Pseudocercospora fijiensis CIRAD86]
MSRLPTAADFPPKLKLSIVPPPNNDPPTNILVLLHGLGDTHASFANLGKQMNLPETACISLQGPQPLLDLGGFHYGDDIIFDSTSGGIDADGGFKGTTTILQGLIDDVLLEKCGYQRREIIFFGFGQGGMAALNLAVKDPTLIELGGVISIGAGLPSSAPASLEPKCRTPVLVCAGSDNSSVTDSSEEKLRKVFQNVEIKRYRKAGDSMPSNKDEMMPIMQFFSRRLKSVKGVPEGAVEVS